MRIVGRLGLGINGGRMKTHDKPLVRFSCARRLLVVTVILLLFPIMAGIAQEDEAPEKASPDNVSVTGPEPRSYQMPFLAMNRTNPERLAVAYQEGAQLQTCFLGLSTDGGKTWTNKPLVGNGGEFPMPPDFTQCQFPVVAYTPDGTLYYVFQFTQGAGYSRTLLAVSSDGGATFSEPRFVDPNQPPASQADAAGGDWVPAITVDQSTEPPKKGRAYVTWGRYNSEFSDASLLVASFHPLGQATSPPVQVNSAVEAPIGQRHAPMVGREGKVYVVYVDFSPSPMVGKTGPATLNISASEDEAKSFGVPTPIADVETGCTLPETPGGFPDCDFIKLPTSPASGIGNSARQIFVAWSAPHSGKARVFFSASHDGGRSWTSPQIIGVPAGGDDHDQFRPALSVSPRGRVDILYYDLAPGDLENIYWTYSSDAGKSFSSPRRLTDVPSDTNIAPASGFGNANFGSGLGLASTDTRVLAAWTDSRRGTRDNAKQDIFFAQAELPGALSWAPWLYIGIGAAVVVGLVLIGLAFLRRRRASTVP